MPNITNITPPRVPFTDPRTGLISREWYRFFLDMFMLTGNGSNNVSLTDLQVGPPQVNDLLGELGLAIDQTQLSVMMAQYESCCGKLQDLEVSPSAESLIPVVQSIQGLEITPTVCDPRVNRIKDDLDFVLTAPSPDHHLKRRSYGAFHDTTTQTAALINTPYGMTFNSTDISNGVWVNSADKSKIYTDRIGAYNIQFSAQLNKTTAVAKNVWIWLRQNGSDIAYSNTRVTLAGSAAATVAAWNWVVNLNAGDYIQIMWATDSTDCVIEADPANAFSPAIPSIILTVTDNINEYIY